MIRKRGLKNFLYWGFFGVLALLSLSFITEIFALRYAYDAAQYAPDGYYQTSPDADLSVVEFLSYNCSYCKETYPALQEAIRKDGRITYIPKPILMNDAPAVLAAKATYSAGYQGQFMAMHDALLNNEGTIDDALLQNLALGLGLDAPKLKEQMESAEIAEVLQENTTTFSVLGGTGTPSFLIGGRIFYLPRDRMPTTEDFLLMFEEARKL